MAVTVLFTFNDDDTINMDPSEDCTDYEIRCIAAFTLHYSCQRGLGYEGMRELIEQAATKLRNWPTEELPQDEAGE